ncbi:MAG: MBL fold metallo-hydrolase [Proteobacteria bacterium]|nr:MBL fold metallo-hydrolase [Pseudomonadota bacterium]MBU1743188.1 MBL fold metallo-hydrolase [Pseudomonadota bacterium]
MDHMDRRDFLTTVTVGGAAFSMAGALWPTPILAAPGKPADIGQCKSVKVTCVSEVGWWDTKKLIKGLMAAGGPKKADQWTMPSDLNNGAGSSSLIEVTLLDGKVKRILLDTGWNPAYMAWRYQMTGVDKLLKQNKIDYFIVSHEHLDHFFGLEATLRLNPKVTMVIPETFRPQARQFMAGKSFTKASAVTNVKHQGKLMVMKKSGVHKLFDGAALSVFDIPIILKIRGEQSLYFNVKDKGLVLITGCCHQTILKYADFAQKNIKGGDKMYGLYGGLHIAPFGPLKPPQAAWIRGMAQYKFKKVASNHCTGLPAVAYMKKLGYPVVGGRGMEGSMSKLYVGNSDAVTFG